MVRLYTCMVHDHDWRLVLLAGLVAATGSFTVVSLLRHSSQLEHGQRRLAWLAATAVAAGSAIWATHFVAMLAFHPPVPVSYDIVLTSLTLVVAIAMAGAGFDLALLRPSWPMRAFGGGVVGLGIATMHYMGMAAIDLNGVILWNSSTLATSVVCGMALSAAATLLTLDGGGLINRIGGGVLFTLAICSLHFIGMAAVTIDIVGPVTVVADAETPALLAINIAVICMVILALASAAVQLNRRSARLREAERANLGELADLAVEGLVVCKDNIVVTANASFEQMVGIDRDALRGTHIESLFEDGAGVNSGEPARAATVPMDRERIVRSARGERIPVELVHKPISYSGKPHQVFAFRDLRERRKAEAEIRFLAHHDPLTGLANRTSFNVTLSRLVKEHVREGRPFAVFALDLDRFKQVNDSLGHQIGDLLLKRVADRLRATVRETDAIARLGGDEFAILVPGPVGADKATALAYRIVEIIRRPYIIGGKIVNIGASIGVAFAPQDGVDALGLMKNADVALYRAKTDGRNTVRRYEISMDDELQTRRTLELDLRRAIVHEQLEVRYQPLYDVQMRSVQGFEALLRWHHPERGMISPAEFIPLAEETGLIVPIGEFVLRASTEEAMRWGPNTTVSVNLSAVQFSKGDIVQTVRSALTNSGLAPQRLELEITESVLLHDGTETLRTLHQLRALGVRISMDDFGTGYSSLRYLRSFPFDKIKIDRSFVQEMLSNDESAAIISAVVALGQRLGILTTAEGVETEEQMARVQAEGCDIVQGYLVGPAVPASQAAGYLTHKEMA